MFNQVLQKGKVEINYQVTDNEKVIINRFWEILSYSYHFIEISLLIFTQLPGDDTIASKKDNLRFRGRSIKKKRKPTENSKFGPYFRAPTHPNLRI